MSVLSWIILSVLAAVIVAMFLNAMGKLNKSTLVKDAAELFLEKTRAHALKTMNESELALYQGGNTAILGDKVDAILDKTIPGHKELRAELAFHLHQIRFKKAQLSMYGYDASVAESCRNDIAEFQSIVDTCRQELNTLYTEQWYQNY